MSENDELSAVRTEGATAMVLSVPRGPREVLAEARDAALALKDVIDKKPRKVEFNGEVYLEFEDWLTVGRFYGLAPKITGTRFVDFDGVKGWEATAEAVHVQSGRVVSSADAMCLNDEEKWRARPKYVWAYVTKANTREVEDPGPAAIVWIDNPSKPGRKMPKKERILQGEEAVPLFQLRSMAQTRAAAKAMRNALAWVVVLAGYKPTPAEELPDAHVVEATLVTPTTNGENGGEKKDEADELFKYEPPKAERAAKAKAAVEQGAITAENRKERERLLTKADEIAQELGMSEDMTQTIWSTYVGTATRKNVAVKELTEMVGFLELKLEQKATGAA